MGGKFFSKYTIFAVLDLFIIVKNKWSQRNLKNVPLLILKVTGNKQPSSFPVVSGKTVGEWSRVWKSYMARHCLSRQTQWNWREGTVLKGSPCSSGGPELRFQEPMSPYNHLELKIKGFVTLSRPLWRSNTWAHIHTCTH